MQQLIWTVVHDDSEWADYVKDDNSATHHEDLYHYTEGYYQYMPEDPLTDRLSLWNTFYKKMCADYETKVGELPKLGYEYQLLHMSQEILPVYVLCEEGLKWYEIDDIDDLRYAEENIIQYL